MNIHRKNKMATANICFFLFCSMLSYELPKSEPNMLIKMPGRKHLVFGRLKDKGISRKVLVSPFWSPLNSVYAFSLRRKQENVHLIEECGTSFNSGRMCALLGESW